MSLDEKSQQKNDRTLPPNGKRPKLRGRPFKSDRDLRGDEDFSGWDLRGVNFKGLDLSGVNFANADIRGANFADATLRNANFTGAKAGLRKRWMIAQFIGIFLLSTSLTFFSYFFNETLLPNYFSPESIIHGNIFTYLSIAITLITSCSVIAYQGLTARAVGIILSTGATIFTIALVYSVALDAIVPDAGSGEFTDSSVIGGIGASVALTCASLISIIVAGVFLGVGVFLGAGIFASTGVVVGGIGGIVLGGEFTGAIAVAAAVLMLGFFIAWRTTKGDKKFVLAHSLGINIGAIGGTSFCGADLTAADFSGAILKSTNFDSSKKKQTILTHVCWSNVQQLDRTKTGSSILSDVAVRTLLVGEHGYQKTYTGANFYSADLSGKDLKEANLKGANLSHALLQKTDLRGTNLSETLAIGADFTGAYLTGACIEAWNIDAKTILKDIDCQHIFLLENHCERRPSSGHFAPGEFTKLFQEVLSTIDLIFQDGID
jgi:uncharacterized protein YjbI with pentapeptide repeats